MPLPIAILPLQLSLAVGGELGVGYDSTANDPRNGRYVDAALVRGALDAQVTHQGSYTRQLLRNRFEAMYEATGGRDPLDSDVFNITRYALAWEPSDRVALHTEGTYAIGAPTLFFSRAGRPDVSFARRGLAYPRQMVADWSVRQDLVYRFAEHDTLQLDGAVGGRYRVTPAPRGQNMFTPYAAATWTHDFSYDDGGVLAARAEHYDLELFRPAWVTTAYLGWNHRFDADSAMRLEAGGTLAQRNFGNDGWEPQPYGRATAFRRFERARLLIGASYVHTWGLVSATLGTGPLDAFTAAMFYHPGDDRWVVYGEAAIQRGEGLSPGTEQPVVATIATAALGTRFQYRPWLRFFARYDFQYETTDALRAAMLPDMVRHVAILGVAIAWGSDADALGTMLPMEEIQAIEIARGVGRLPATAPQRAAETARDDHDRRRRGARLPGDPPDDEREREERERQRWERRDDDNDAAPGQGAAPGEAEQPEPGDPFRGEREE